MYGTRSQISREVANSSSGSRQPLNEHSPGFQNDHFPTWGFFKVSEVPRRARGHYVRASHYSTAHPLADTPTAYTAMQQLPWLCRPCHSTVVAEGHHSASHCWTAASDCHLHPVPSCTLPAVHSIIMHVCVLSRFSHVRLCATPWTVAHLAPLSVGFSRQEYWSGLPCPPPGDLPNPEVKPSSVMSPALAGRFFTTIAT